MRCILVKVSTYGFQVTVQECNQGFHSFRLERGSIGAHSPRASFSVLAPSLDRRLKIASGVCKNLSPFSGLAGVHNAAEPTRGEVDDVCFSHFHY